MPKPTISPERWERLQAVFHAVLARPTGNRDAALAEICGNDAALLAEATSLLAAHRRTGVVPEDASAAATVLSAALAKRYAVERAIGAGGMATVYLAQDVKHERPVAVKVMRGNVASAISAKRFLREIRVTANLQHPHILPLYDSGDADGLLYYVMPFVAGGSLGQRLEEDGPLPVPDALDTVHAVAEALGYAHREGVIHRDIKPENILLQQGQALMADFGIAQAASVTSDGRLTDAGVPMGTPSYMSPEQASGEDDVDARTDVYALACVLYECLTGHPPYVGPSVRAVLSQHLVAPVPSVARARAEVPTSVHEAITRALAKEPSDRFSSMADFASALLGDTSPARSASAVRIEVPDSTSRHRSLSSLAGRQEIQFCTASDGVKIAYASVGEGPTLVKAANWLSHLEYDWESPMWRHWWEGLARHHRLVRYDERGCGLSDWTAVDMSFEAWVADLEAVVDAANLDRFALLGVSQGGPIAIAYAVRHPERVTHLVLHGSYALGAGKRPGADEANEAAALIDLVRLGWGRENPAFRQVFSTLFYPDASAEQLRWFNEQQRQSSTGENAARMLQGFHHIDVRALAPRVTAPSLVLHCDAEARIPFEAGRSLASLIPGSRFVPLASRNHIPLEDEPAWGQFLAAVYDFLGVAGG